MPRLPAFLRISRNPDGREPRLAPIGVAITVLLILAAGLAVTLVWIALAWFHPRTVGDHLDVVKIALAIVGGVGGVVALVVAYRKQRLAEAAQKLDEKKHRLAETSEDRERSRLYAERFDSASGKLGSDNAAVRLAGVHALAGLADDWRGGRQTCIDVLCAYLRMPPGPEPVPDGDQRNRTAWLAMREVRATIVRLIGAHLGRDTSPAWRGCDLDFSGVIFDFGADFGNAVIDSGEINFIGAEFSGDVVSFTGVEFSGGVVNFTSAKFLDGFVMFFGAKFLAGIVDFSGAQFLGSEISFDGAEFSGRSVAFMDAQFSDGAVDFSRIRDWSKPPIGLPPPPSEVIIYPPASMADSSHADDAWRDEPPGPDSDELP